MVTNYHVIVELAQILDHAARHPVMVIPIWVRDVNITGTRLRDISGLPRGEVPLSRCENSKNALAQIAQELDSLSGSGLRAIAPRETPTDVSPAVVVKKKVGSPVRVILVAAADDSLASQALKRHPAVLRHTGEVEITTSEPGELQTWAEAGLSTLVVVLCSSALRSAVSDSFWSHLSNERVVPVLLDHPSSLPRELEGAHALPSNDTSMADWSDADHFWCHISCQLAEVVTEPEQAPGSVGADGSPFVLCDSYAGQDETARASFAVFSRWARRHPTGGFIVRSGTRAGTRLEEGPARAQLNALFVSRHFLASRACAAQMAVALRRHEAGEAIAVVVRLDDVGLPEPLTRLPALPATGDALVAEPGDVEDGWRHWELAFLELVEIAKLARTMIARRGDLPARDS